MKTAHKLQSMGRNGDTLLAHINPKEAYMLKSMGGSGTKNPKTGLLEFYDADPEGNADANRANGTAGIEGQGGFGGPEYGSLNGTDIAAMMALDAQLAPNYAQAPTIGAAPASNAPSAADIARAIFGGVPGLINFGIDRYNNRGWSNNTSFNMPGDQVSRGNGFDGGNLPSDNLANQPGGLLGSSPTTPTTPAATPYTYNRPAFTPTFGQLRTANFTNPYSRRGGLLGG